jgi:hypothetical protein
MTTVIGTLFNDCLACTETEAEIRTKDSGELVQKLNTKHMLMFCNQTAEHENNIKWLISPWNGGADHILGHINKSTLN